MPIGFIQTMVVFIKKLNKIDFPHNAITKHRAICRMCRWDSKASTVTSRRTHGFPMRMTSLCWLCYPVGTFLRQMEDRNFATHVHEVFYEIAIERTL